MPATTTSLPLSRYRETATRQPRPVHKGLDAIADRIAGWNHRRGSRGQGDLARGTRIAEAVSEHHGIRTPELASRLAKHAHAHRRAGSRPLPEAATEAALAALAEAAFRTLHLRPYPEQLAGALALRSRTVAEMATGEGKTLTLALAATLAAWRGLPVHIITANDYLVTRDRDWLAPFYELCGLSAGAVTGAAEATARRAAYHCAITYVTSKEVTADFLRDRIQLEDLSHPSRRLIREILQPGIRTRQATVMRGLHTAIIDEADHVLIDEAVTPLIISRPTQNRDLESACKTAASLAASLSHSTHYHIDEKRRELDLTRAGHAFAAAQTHAFSGIWRSPDRREDLLLQALRAKHFFLRGKQYIISDEQKIVIVDEATGRTMEQRTWKQGLHQAIEAKEDVPLTPPTETLARLSFQRFFRLYPELSGVTGTAAEASFEFWSTYKLKVVKIPTHRPIARTLSTPIIATKSGDRWEAVADEIARVHATGRPILVGTRSVAASEHLAAILESRQLPYAILNAVRHQEEANIVAAAGQPACITIATNMAGRGTDIKLPPSIQEAGGLHVISTEGQDSGRIDRQLFGRSARQGEPGSARLFASLEDELVKRFAPIGTRTAVSTALQAKLPGSQKIALTLLRHAQKRSMSQAFTQRKRVLQQDDWLEESLSFQRGNV